MKEHKRIKILSIIASSVIIILFACVLIVAYAMTKAAPASQELVRRGAYLARAGDCIACHTT
jgi:mono/diheme cytochrome c family protein